MTIFNVEKLMRESRIATGKCKHCDHTLYYSVGTIHSLRRFDRSRLQCGLDDIVDYNSWHNDVGRMSTHTDSNRRHNGTLLYVICEFW